MSKIVGPRKEEFATIGDSATPSSISAPSLLAAATAQLHGIEKQLSSSGLATPTIAHSTLQKMQIVKNSQEFYDACEFGDVEVVKNLLQRGAQINEPSPSDKPMLPIEIAANRNHAAVVGVLCAA